MCERSSIFFSKEKEESLLAQIVAHENYIDKTQEDITRLKTIEKASDASHPTISSEDSNLLRLSTDSKDVPSFG